MSLSLEHLFHFWKMGHGIRGLPLPSNVEQFAQSPLLRNELQNHYQYQMKPTDKAPFPLSLGPIQIGRPGFDRLFPTASSWSTSSKSNPKVAVCITHDVDLFDGLSYFPLRFTGWVHTAAKAKRAGDQKHYQRTLKRIREWTKLWWKAEDPIAHFEPWLDLSRKYDFKATYFFLSVEKALSREGRLYTFSDPRVHSLLQQLQDQGHEIGLHANRFESGSIEGLKRQKHRLEKAIQNPVTQIRHHCLTLNFPHGWYDLIHAGFRLSSNVGHHPPNQGYLNGSSWPFPILFPQEKSRSMKPLWECPMAIMDVAYGPAASRLWASLTHLLQDLKLRGGVCVLNFHPHYRVECEAPRVHQQVLKIMDILNRGRDEGWLEFLSLGEIEQKLNQRLLDSLLLN